MENKELKKKAFIKLIISISTLIICGILFALPAKPILQLSGDKEALNNYLQTKGVWGNAYFILIIFMEVLVGVIPAGPIQIASGYLYGSIWGIVIYDITAALASLTACFLARKFGRNLVYILANEDSLKKIEKVSEGNNVAAFLFIFYFVPGLPKDILAYFAGLTDISYWKFFLIVMIARIFPISLSVLSGSSLANNNYLVLIICSIITVISIILGHLYYKKMHNK